MTQVLQISDPHILPKGMLFARKIDTAASLRTLLEGLKQALPLIGPVDKLVVTGDLSESGCTASYDHFAEIMECCPLPWRAIPGNHDGRKAMGDLLCQEQLFWREDLPGLTILGLDSSVDGAAHGEVPAQQLNWLAAQLSVLRKTPTLLFLHHPPLPIGISIMDEIRLANAAALEEVLIAHRGPLQIGCGHIHRTSFCRFGGHPLFTAPGASHSLVYDRRTDQPLFAVPTVGGALLHVWSNETQFSCHLLAGDELSPDLRVRLI